MNLRGTAAMLSGKIDEIGRSPPARGDASGRAKRGDDPCGKFDVAVDGDDLLGEV